MQVKITSEGYYSGLVELTAEEFGILADILSRMQAYITENDYAKDSDGNEQYIGQALVKATNVAGLNTYVDHVKAEIVPESVIVFDSLTEFEQRNNIRAISELRRQMSDVELAKMVEHDKARLERLKNPPKEGPDQQIAGQQQEQIAQQACSAIGG